MEDLAPRLERYLRHAMPAASEMSITHLTRIHGGASRETYRVRISFSQGGRSLERGLIVRRDPADSLIETERSLEFAAYGAFHGSAIPVPRPLFLEMDPAWLGSPFFVMEEVRDAEAASPFALDPFGEHKESIGNDFWSLLGRLARHDPDTVDLGEGSTRPAADDCWRQELDHWQRVIEEDELTPEPLLWATLRRLRRNPPPPPAKLAVVHGDYRTGNFLHRDGRIVAVLDWEMCHLGEPLEDVAWALNPLWCFLQPALPGQMIPRANALDLWQRESGIQIDETALAWWELFSTVKGLAIWISSSKAYVSTGNKDPVLAFTGWWCTSLHILLLRLQLQQVALPS